LLLYGILNLMLDGLYDKRAVESIMSSSEEGPEPPTKNLDGIGRSQDLPDTYLLLAHSPAVK
jgi:hypothetical protein